jgi:hypothetical protein
MAQPINIRRVLFPVLFVAFSFGTGFLLVTASQQNTEDRSKASFDGPYVCTAACSPPTGNIGSASCQACMSGIAPTPIVLAPGTQCVISNSSNPISCNHCEYGVAGSEAAMDGQTRACAFSETPDLESCTHVFNGHCYASEEDVQRAQHNAELRGQVKCFLPGFCNFFEEPTPIY